MYTISHTCMWLLFVVWYQLCFDSGFCSHIYIGVATAEARATRILKGLGFEDNVIASTPTDALSGGWAMRAALAAALFVSPDMLLLDEVCEFVA